MSSQERVDHVALAVSDFDGSVALLQRLGLDLRRTGTLTVDPSRRIAMLADRTGFKIELIESSTDGLAHVALETEDVGKAHRGGVAAGLQTQREPYRIEPARADSAMLVAPTGLLVQYVRYDEDSPDR